MKGYIAQIKSVFVTPLAGWPEVEKDLVRCNTDTTTPPYLLIHQLSDAARRGYDECVEAFNSRTKFMDALDEISRVLHERLEASPVQLASTEPISFHGYHLFVPFRSIEELQAAVDLVDRERAEFKPVLSQMTPRLNEMYDLVTEISNVCTQGPEAAAKTET